MIDIKKTLAKAVNFEDDTKKSTKSEVRVVSGVERKVTAKTIAPFTI